VLFKGTPISTPFERFVQDLRQGAYSEDGREGSVPSVSSGQKNAETKNRQLFGSASIKRFILANTAGRHKSQGAGGLVLAELGSKLALLDNQKLFYQSKKSNEGDQNAIQQRRSGNNGQERGKDAGLEDQNQREAE